MGSSKVKDSAKLVTDSGKYARYTPEQVEILERVYNECQKPSSSRRQQLIRECPSLTNIGQKQLKVWFQNRRCREKQRKETGRLQNWNSKLNAMNQILLEENERLQKQASQMSLENQYLKQQLQLQQTQAVLPTTNDTSSESVVTSGHHHQHHSPQASHELSTPQLSALAEKILSEFLAKAGGGMGNGIPLPGMKPGPDSIGALVFPLSGGRVAAQSCGLVNLEAFKIADVIKNRTAWLQDCRKQEVKGSFTQSHGGVIELVHTQMYAPMALATARDFWTLRYTCLLEDGNFVVCEGSLATGQGMQEMPNSSGFVRAEMLASGVLIRPCEQGGSVVMAIDDMNFMVGNHSHMECLQPLYGTSTILAWRVTYKVLCYLRGLAKERMDMGSTNNPSSSLQGFIHRLARGFNDSINCFSDDGWFSLINDGPGSVSVHFNPPQSGKLTCPAGTPQRGIMCAKASVLVHDVPPPLFVSFLRERVAIWSDFDAETKSDILNDNTAKSKGHTVKLFQPVSSPNEVLEVVKLKSSNISKAVNEWEGERFLLQLCSNMEDTSPGAFAHMIFAPVHGSMLDDSPLLPSGFRIMYLEEKLASQTLDLASALDEQSTTNTNRLPNKSLHNLGLVLTISFQYVYDLDNRDPTALKAQRNVQALVGLLQQVSISLSPQPPQCSVESLLVKQLVDSYRYYIGQELLLCTDGTAEGLFKSFWNLPHAIFCCAWKPLPEFIFANHAALEMLESSSSGLREMSLERMFNDDCRRTDYSQPPPFLQKEGYAWLPAGACWSSTGRTVSFERATGWKVLTGEDQQMQIAAFMFVNWSFTDILNL